MTSLEEKLKIIKEHMDKQNIKIMILGLGSVGNYLLDYLSSSLGEGSEIIVVGRDNDKMESDVNIIRISALIRKQMRSKIIIEKDVDFNDVGVLKACFEKYCPDFIVNSSRVYAGLKYGSISWNNIRAYGIWAPLAVKYIKNIMDAYEQAEQKGIVINTSYSDAVIPWLKSAGKPYPDFGSGNLNHLVPRIQYAVAQMVSVEDYWNVEVIFATSHFHDVVISKEGQTEGVEQLIRLFYRGTELTVNSTELFSRCSILMPSGEKRNMMNASSNYEIIMSIIKVLDERGKKRFFSPGAFGEIGGYPIMIDGTVENPVVSIDESMFSLDEMKKKNRESIYLDGIENVESGVLIYTDELISKVRERFHIELSKRITLEDSEKTADLLIREVINKNRL